jgi:hypothetical protein
MMKKPTKKSSGTGTGRRHRTVEEVGASKRAPLNAHLRFARVFAALPAALLNRFAKPLVGTLTASHSTAAKRFWQMGGLDLHPIRTEIEAECGARIFRQEDDRPGQVYGLRHRCRSINSQLTPMHLGQGLA